MKIAVFTATLLVTATTAAFAAEPTSAMTQDFVTKASIAGMFEIESSKVALNKSTNAEVKSFASQMIADHTAADKKLKATLASKKIDAKPATALDSEKQELLTNLKTQEASDFDDAYIDAQVDAHNEATTLFKDYAEDGDNASLKKFAADTLPTLEKHKSHVEMLEENL